MRILLEPTAIVFQDDDGEETIYAVTPGEYREYLSTCFGQDDWHAWDNYRRDPQREIRAIYTKFGALFTPIYQSRISEPRRPDNPNNCETCHWKSQHADGHCYMFRNEPTDVCMQHTGRGRLLYLLNPNTDILAGLFKSK
jgi:hypothetical protein